MALIDEVKAEVIQRNKSAVRPMAEAPAGELKKTRRRRKLEEMTNEEREAWLQKKRDEEEARYLKDMAKESKEPTPDVPKVKRARRMKATPEPASKPAPQPVQRRSKVDPQRPRVLQPMEPLYLLKIPGLPKGDCIAICYVRGEEQ